MCLKVEEWMFIWIFGSFFTVLLFFRMFHIASYWFLHMGDIYIGPSQREDSSIQIIL